MTAFHYDYTPVPVGLPYGMNGSKTSYLLGIYDGAYHEPQRSDDPDYGVLFQSPDAAQDWLAAVAAVLGPYIATGDTSVRVPDPDGWEEQES